MTSLEQERIAIEKRQADSEKAKREYIESKTLDRLSLKQDNPTVSLEAAEMAPSEFIFKDLAKRIEDASRIAAENYVRGALKTREKDMECFRNLTAEMGRVEELLEGLRDAMVNALEETILTALQEIKDALQKQTAKDPLETQAYLELIRVLREY